MQIQFRSLHRCCPDVSSTEPENSCIHNLSTLGFLRGIRGGAYDSALKYSSIVRKGAGMQTRNERLGKMSRGFPGRRAHVRYPLRLCVGYRWKDNDGTKHGSKGWTRNISEEGAFIKAVACPAEEDLVDLLFQMPRDRSLPAVRAVRMTLQARVVRVVRNAEEGIDVGFAVHKRTGFPAGDNHATGRKDSGERRVNWRVN